MSSHKFRHNKLEQHRGLLLQISIIISLLIMLAAFNFKSKNTSSGNFVEINLEVDTIKSNNNKIIKPLPQTPNSHISITAQFPGGEKALKLYIKKNLRYPEKAKNKNIQGRVYVKFTISGYGKIKNITVIRSIDPMIDREAVRLIKNMPDWIPAKTNSGTTESEQILPVIFINNSI